ELVAVVVFVGSKVSVASLVLVSGSAGLDVGRAVEVASGVICETAVVGVAAGLYPAILSAMPQRAHKPKMVAMLISTPQPRMPNLPLRGAFCQESRTPFTVLLPQHLFSETP